MKILIFICAIILSMNIVLAEQNEEFDPGMTPDSAFYFVDTLFDFFQSEKSLSKERAAEVLAMADKEDLEALEEAIEGYRKIIEKREKQVEEDEEKAEELAKDSSKYLEKMAKAHEKASEKACKELKKSMSESAEARYNSIESLKKKDLKKGERIENITEEELMKSIPESEKDNVKDLLKFTEMKNKYNEHLRAFNKNIECNIFPEKIRVQELSKYTNKTEFTPGELLVTLNEIIEQAGMENNTEKAKNMIEDAKNVADKISNQYGRGKGYWENNEECPNEEKESDERSENQKDDVFADEKCELDLDCEDDESCIEGECRKSDEQSSEGSGNQENN